MMKGLTCMRRRTAKGIRNRIVIFDSQLICSFLISSAYPASYFFHISNCSASQSLSHCLSLSILLCFCTFSSFYCTLLCTYLNTTIERTLMLQQLEAKLKLSAADPSLLLVLSFLSLSLPPSHYLYISLPLPQLFPLVS